MRDAMWDLFWDEQKCQLILVESTKQNFPCELSYSNLIYLFPLAQPCIEGLSDGFLVDSLVEVLPLQVIPPSLYQALRLQLR